MNNNIHNIYTIMAHLLVKKVAQIGIANVKFKMSYNWNQQK